jgi:hypothetical protein
MGSNKYMYPNHYHTDDKKLTLEDFQALSNWIYRYIRRWQLETYDLHRDAEFNVPGQVNATFTKLLPRFGTSFKKSEMEGAMKYLTAEEVKKMYDACCYQCPLLDSNNVFTVFFPEFNVELVDFETIKNIVSKIYHEFMKYYYDVKVQLEKERFYKMIETFYLILVMGAEENEKVFLEWINDNRKAS